MSSKSIEFDYFGNGIPNIHSEINSVSIWRELIFTHGANKTKYSNWDGYALWLDFNEE